MRCHWRMEQAQRTLSRLPMVRPSATGGAYGHSPLGIALVQSATGGAILRHDERREASPARVQARHPEPRPGRSADGPCDRGGEEPPRACRGTAGSRAYRAERMNPSTWVDEQGRPAPSGHARAAGGRFRCSRSHRAAQVLRLATLAALERRRVVRPMRGGAIAR